MNNVKNYKIILNLFFQLDFSTIINDEYLGSPYVKERCRMICKKLIPSKKESTISYIYFCAYVNANEMKENTILLL